MADKELHARIVLYDVDTMSDKDHKRLLDWLHKLAYDVRNISRKQLAKKYTARLWK